MFFKMDGLVKNRAYFFQAAKGNYIGIFAKFIPLIGFCLLYR